MKKLLIVLSVITAVLAFNVTPVAFAEETLPEIAVVDDVAIPSLEATTDIQSTSDASN